MASGLRFGRYEALFRIAAGGMAEVFAARITGEAGFEKVVAVKRMLPHLADDEALNDMFLDEGRLAAHVRSPYVVETLDLGRDEWGAAYIAMELVEGLSLSQLIKRCVELRLPLPLEVGLAILVQVATGLHHAHTARTPAGEPLGLVHRDISPQNVLVGADGRARITDFGIARADVARLTRTQTGTVKGKFRYFSPEQTRRTDVDARSDVFALGIVAWETFAQEPLFSGGGNPAVIFDEVRGKPIPRLDARPPFVPGPIADVVARALERDLARRTRSAGDLSRDLRAAATDCGIAIADDDAVAEFVRALGAPEFDEMRRKLEEAARLTDGPGTQAEAPAPSPAVSVVSEPSDAPRVVPPTTPARPPALAATEVDTSTFSAALRTRRSAVAAAVVLAVAVLVAGVIVLSTGPAAPAVAPAAVAAPVIPAVAAPTPEPAPVPERVEGVEDEPPTPAPSDREPTGSRAARGRAAPSPARVEPPPPPPPRPPRVRAGSPLGDDAFERHVR